MSFGVIKKWAVYVSMFFAGGLWVEWFYGDYEKWLIVIPALFLGGSLLGLVLVDEWKKKKRGRGK